MIRGKLERVTDFIHFGHMVPDNGKCDMEINRRIGVTICHIMFNTLSLRDMRLDRVQPD